MLATAKRYREIAVSLLTYAEETGPDGPRDACINLAVLYQQAAREIEQRYQGWQASTSRSGAIDETVGGTGGVAA
ncbi:MAG TPA: hypothetical protein VN823_27580 [Stellaceae bacterium]|nr:hypothetical protein [Stellaceae bacterium]